MSGVARPEWRPPVFAFFPNHPSQIWVLRPVAAALEGQGLARVIWFLRDKDVALELARRLGLQFIVVSRARSGLLGNAWELLANIPRCVHFSFKYRVDAWVTKYGCGSIAAMLAGRPAVAFNDDDADVVPLIALTSYPFSERVLVPAVTRMGRYEWKARRYPGNHELFYLHPSRFQPDSSVRAELGLDATTPYALVRLSALQAHHDRGVRGVEAGVVREVVRIGEECGIRLFITSEKPLDAELERYRLSIPVHRIHHALAHAEFLVGDSQTMTAEAAILGTPAFRLSDFVGRISYLDELEHFGLSFGYRPDDAKRMLEDLGRMIRDPDRKRVMAERRAEFLRTHPDPVPWFIDGLLAALEPAPRGAIRARRARDGAR